MPAIVLFFGRIVLILALFLFIFCIMKTGVGLVKGQKSDAAVWAIDIIEAPDNVRGSHIDIFDPVIVGRSPGSDIVLSGMYVSGRHARFSIQGAALVIEDLGSTNGTLANGRPVTGTVVLHDGDLVEIGDVSMRVTRQ